MINLLNRYNKIDENRHSFVCTYPRTVNIIYGNYPYPERINDFILEIKKNVVHEMTDHTYVKGSMTHWNHFADKKIFTDYINFLINKHQSSHPEEFQYFYQSKTITAAWGTETKPGDYVEPHQHFAMHCILYLTEGCDLLLPELNITITPKPGDYYIFPPNIIHGFDTYIGEKNRYCMVFNYISTGHFDLRIKKQQLNKKVEQRDERTKRENS